MVLNCVHFNKEIRKKNSKQISFVCAYIHVLVATLIERKAAISVFHAFLGRGKRQPIGRIRGQQAHGVTLEQSDAQINKVAQYVDELL